MGRRDFIRSACNACLLLTAGLALPAITSCGPASFQVLQSEVIEDRIGIPLDSFAQASLRLVRPGGWYYSIAVEKKEDNTYAAFLLRCTHQDNQLTPASNGYTCSLHGSHFNREGNATKGPAERPLKQYPVTRDGKNLIIHLKA